MECLYKNRGFPCGRCIACRLNRQNEKKIRLCQEAESWKDKVFITLTYKDELLPPDRSLVKRDVQLFLKKLRKAIEPTKIKYFCCGEYGDHTFRPHYHLIIFGLGLKDKVFQNHQYVSGKDVWYVKCDAWDKGFVSLNPVTPARCAYVAKYCVKKLGGKCEEEYQGRAKEFCLTSRGIGLKWALEHVALLKNNLIYMNHTGKRVAIPRYYIQKVFDNVSLYKRQKLLEQVMYDKCSKKLQDSIENGRHDMTFEQHEQWKKDLRDAQELRFARKLQMKGKTNNV